MNGNKLHEQEIRQRLRELGIPLEDGNGLSVEEKIYVLLALGDAQVANSPIAYELGRFAIETLFKQGLLVIAFGDVDRGIRTILEFPDVCISQKAASLGLNEADVECLVRWAKWFRSDERMTAAETLRIKCLLECG